MTTIYVKFRPSTASDEVRRKLCGLGLLNETEFQILESSQNVAHTAILKVSRDDETRYRRSVMMLPQVECIE